MQKMFFNSITKLNISPSFTDQSRRARSFYQVHHDKEFESRPLNLQSFQFGNNVDFHSSKNGLLPSYTLVTILIALTAVLNFCNQSIGL